MLFLSSKLPHGMPAKETYWPTRILMKTKMEPAVQRAQTGQRSTYRKARGPRTNPEFRLTHEARLVNIGI